MTLCLVHISVGEFRPTIEVEMETLVEAMVVVYEEISKMHHIVAPMVIIQVHTKERVAILKEAMTTLYKIH